MLKIPPMGIKGLNAYLRKSCPSAFVEIPKSRFKGKRIAIDSNNILYRFMSRAHKEIVNKTDVATMEPDRDEIIKRWLYHVKIFLLDLIKIGATPIFVFDGEYIAEKSKTQEKRKADKQKMINDAENTKLLILEVDELERTPAMITELRKKMQNLGYLGSDEKNMIQGILTSIGIPVLIAKGEGEKLCAMLCIEGKVDAVYSRDTDLLVFGCPLTINEPSGYVYNEQTKQTEESFQCTVFKPVLSTLGLTYSTFVDFCIMAGCDFNDNIPHLGVGKSYDVLQHCKSIDNLPDKYHKKCTCNNSGHETCQRIKENYEDQVDCLNHIRCREIFAHASSETICQDEILLDIKTNLDEARDRLEMFGAEDWLRDIVPLYQNVIPSSNVCIPKMPSLSSSSLKLNISKNKTVSTGPILNIVSKELIKQKELHKYVNSRNVKQMNQNQHVRLQQRGYPIDKINISINK
jgi:flap endonuclease-1